MNLGSEVLGLQGALKCLSHGFAKSHSEVEEVAGKSFSISSSICTLWHLEALS